MPIELSLACFLSKEAITLRISHELLFRDCKAEIAVKPISKAKNKRKLQNHEVASPVQRLNYDISSLPRFSLPSLGQSPSEQTS
jgi:hypothetical protein